MKVAIAGSVASTKLTLEELIRYDFEISVFGLSKDRSTNVSGYEDLSELALKHNLQYLEFENINSDKVVNALNRFKPDVLFVVGLSQIIRRAIIEIPKLGCVGFHPTKLPHGRGRAALAWLILEEEKVGAATFFVIDEGVDNGPILVQKPFPIEHSDNIAKIREKLHNKIKEALNEWLPLLKDGWWNPRFQDEILASYYEKRTPLDGIINWASPANEIVKLVRATSKPYPGAYSFIKDRKITIWDAIEEKELNIKGVVGRILLIKNNHFLIQSGNGLLWIKEFDIEGEKGKSLISVGQKLGYNVELEIYKLKKELSQ